MRSGRNRVDGWFERADAEIYYEILACQAAHGVGGALAEIGLHHGKSFIALCLALKDGERAYGIDIFEKQELNLDGSGLGSRAALERNLAGFGVDGSAVVLDGRASQTVSPEDILQSVGEVRLFSVDGGHWVDIVCSDLRLAERVISDRGVIALDDFLRPEWPDVSFGFFKWMEERSSPITPFAIGYNKLYLCHEENIGLYTDALMHSGRLEYFRSKYYRFCGNQIPIYQRLPLGGWDWRTRVVEYMKIFYPGLYLSAKRLLNGKDWG